MTPQAATRRVAASDECRDHRAKAEALHADALRIEPPGRRASPGVAAAGVTRLRRARHAPSHPAQRLPAASRPGRQRPHEADGRAHPEPRTSIPPAAMTAKSRACRRAGHRVGLRDEPADCVPPTRRPKASVSMPSQMSTTAASMLAAASQDEDCARHRLETEERTDGPASTRERSARQPTSAWSSRTRASLRQRCRGLAHIL